MKAKEDGIATFRESSFTGSTSKQFGLLLPIGIITNNIPMSLYSIVFTFCVGTITLRYIHAHPSDYVKLFLVSLYHNQKDTARLNYNNMGTIMEIETYKIG
jgi:hypothetical protein